MATSRIEYGKIKSIEFGFGGYQDAQLGVSIDLGGKDWGVSDFKGFWATSCTQHCQWTEADRLYSLGETSMWIKILLQKAKKQKLSQLKNVPVAVTFDGTCLKEWRILEEVI